MLNYNGFAIYTSDNAVDVLDTRDIEPGATYFELHGPAGAVRCGMFRAAWERRNAAEFAANIFSPEFRVIEKGGGR